MASMVILCPGGTFQVDGTMKIYMEDKSDDIPTRPKNWHPILLSI